MHLRANCAAVARFALGLPVGECKRGGRGRGGKQPVGIPRSRQPHPLGSRYGAGRRTDITRRPSPSSQGEASARTSGCIDRPGRDSPSIRRARQAHRRRVGSSSRGRREATDGGPGHRRSPAAHRRLSRAGCADRPACWRLTSFRRSSRLSAASADSNGNGGRAGVGERRETTARTVRELDLNGRAGTVSEESAR
jgi:hypothetical protein